MGLLFYIGTLAAVFTTGSFIPQVIKIKKQGGEDLSYPMLFIYLCGTLALAGVRTDLARGGSNLGQRHHCHPRRFSHYPENDLFPARIERAPKLGP